VIVCLFAPYKYSYILSYLAFLRCSVTVLERAVSMELREQVKWCRAISCVRRRNWSAGCAAATDRACPVVAWIQRQQPRRPELVTLERPARPTHDQQCILTRASRHSDIRAASNHTISTSLHRGRFVPLPSPRLSDGSYSGLPCHALCHIISRLQLSIGNRNSPDPFSH